MTVANGVAATLLKNSDFSYPGDTEGLVGVFCSRPFVGIRKLSFVQAKQGGVEAQLKCSTKAPAGEGVGVHMLSLA